MAEDRIFSVLDKLAKGSFGSVFRVLNINHGAGATLKRMQLHNAVQMLPVSALREHNALDQLRLSPHVVPNLGAVMRGSSISLCMPALPCTLATVLIIRDSPLSHGHATSLSRMLLSGMHAIHAEGLLHRDMKPANVLIADSGCLLIADLGQARIAYQQDWTKKENVRVASGDAPLFSHAVATRWYRAPELLLGSRRYLAGVDIWSCACVLSQLYTLTPLFPGDNDIDQFLKVVWFLGSYTLPRCIRSWRAVSSVSVRFTSQTHVDCVAGGCGFA